MDLERVLVELTKERALLAQAIISLERLAVREKQSTKRAQAPVEVRATVNPDWAHRTAGGQG